MRKRIKQLARGKFEYAKPILAFSEELVDLQVIEDKEYQGDFLITCTNHIPIRGIVYSTNPRMECLTPQFEGEEVRIRYKFHSAGLVDGETEKGEFVIVCNQCEYSLSFVVQISKLYADSSIGQIKTLYDFSCLAKENWSEAYQLFYHKSFSNIIKEKEVKEAMIYRGITATRPSNQNLEEFLIAIGKKNKILFEVEQRSYEFYEITETFQNKLEIKKDGWGFLSLNISSDSEFIRPMRNHVESEDFIGSTYQLAYYIDKDSMHEGKNFGRLTISSVYQTVDIDITASFHEKKEKEAHSVNNQVKECRAGIMELYQAYRLKRIVTGVWANETIEILNHLKVLVPDEPMYELMRAQVYIINRQRQEAEWILEEFKREWVDHKAPIWGYYLYLMTLLEREPSYVDRMTREIELIFHENPDSVLLFWVLSFLQEQYFNNNAGKLKAIEYWCTKGCYSPYLYIEAYYLIWQDPYLLTKLDAFEIRVLRWAIRHHAMTKDISAQIFQIVETTKGFNPVLYQLLCAAYEANPKPENIGMICSYLIKGQKFDTKYHKWYEMGIELELRITSLYEAYLLSMDERKLSPVPKIIQMYFQYESSLPYKRMAILYNNIIASKETNPEVYRKYRRTMGRFAMEQVEAEHMDDNLAVLYEDMLELGLVSEELAHHLSHIIFMNKLVVFDDKMVRAVIYQRQMKDPQIVPIYEQSAYFQLFSDDYIILFEDEKGQRYVNSVSYRLQPLMDPSRYIAKCMELAPNEISYIVSEFRNKQYYLSFTEEDKKYFPSILFGDELSDAYKAEISPEIIRFYQSQEYDGTIKEFLEQANFTQISQNSRKYMIDLLVENHMYEKAYELIQVYGIDQLGSASKVNLASYMMKAMNYEEDDFLLQLVAEAFLVNKYNDEMLEYLVKYYMGPTYVMRNLWTAAKSFDIDTFELEERILTQVLYSDSFLPDVEQIFESYYEAGGKELYVLAFLSASAHGYFVKGQKTDRLIFEIIQNRYLYQMELNDACKLALLKYLSGIHDCTKTQYMIQDELLAEYTCRNMNFAFYKKMDKALVMKYHLYDKIFLEYRTNADRHVVIHYSRDEDGENFVAEDMPNVYDGIFVKSFVMFFGDMVQYYITEEKGVTVEVTESNRITNNDVYNEKDESRYNLLNQMLISNTLQDEASLYKCMKQYEGFHEVTKDIFRIL